MNIIIQTTNNNCRPCYSEMKDRKQAAPGSLSVSLSLFGLAYVTVCLLAGPNPPSFLFDAIPAGAQRRLAGALLWIHVAVSYAINSQAFCSSVERVVGYKLGRHLFGPRLRWTVLTGLVALASYIVANSIPFFKVRSTCINNCVTPSLSQTSTRSFTLLLPGFGLFVWCSYKYPSHADSASNIVSAYMHFDISISFTNRLYDVHDCWLYRCSRLNQCRQKYEGTVLVQLKQNHRSMCLKSLTSKYSIYFIFFCLALCCGTHRHLSKDPKPASIVASNDNARDVNLKLTKFIITTV